ncbi:MAG: hypothetical protein M3Q27_06145 [Actinomycetota bacterium]|nr:hypothetical protein [Actinomycetota bacterium]
MQALALSCAAALGGAAEATLALALVGVLVARVMTRHHLAGAPAHSGIVRDAQGDAADAYPGASPAAPPRTTARPRRPAARTY